MSTNNIRDIIAHLCKLINLLCSSSLKPEHFRLAKFDKQNDNVVSILWDAFFKILQIPSMNNLENIKKQMISLGYSRKEFFIASKFEEHGSREILIALSYLIAYQLEEIIQSKIKESVFSEKYLLTMNRSLHSTPITNLNTNSLNLSELNNYESWLNGRILLNKRGTEDYLEQIARIQLKLNKQFNLKVTGPMTLYELLALKSSKFEDQFLRESREILQMLSCYNEWLKKEKHFWKWMSTVLEVNIRNTTDAEKISE